MDKDTEKVEAEGTFFLSQSLFSDVVDCSGVDTTTPGISTPHESQASGSSISYSPIFERLPEKKGPDSEVEIDQGISSKSPSTSDGRRVGVVGPTIRKLDVVTSSAIRKTQVISKVSDIVRELVENAVDSVAGSIQVHLTDYGLEKIEVKDNGHGITSSEFSKVVSGGFTSKLGDTNHLSSQNFYGFRGEALASISSVASVCITTKTAEDNHAKKYQLDNKSCIISEAVVAGGNGTIIQVSNLFEKFPVRRLWIKDKKKCVAELKDIETFLKSVAIANLQTHISLYHNSTLVWNKASVISTEAALVTVLGHFISKNLKKCGPIDIDVLSDGDKEQQRTIEAFFLKTPIDMRTLSWTGRTMTFIFLNRKRVVIEECEKLIQRYTVATIEKPAPADARRFPVAVVIINLPANEVDFNREMDKSKVFIVNKELVLLKLEELLQSFYGITSLEKPSLNKENEPEIVDEVVPQPLHTAKESARQSTIQLFLESVPTVSNANFSRSPAKTTQEGVVPFPLLRSPMKHIEEVTVNSDKIGPSLTANPQHCVSNFELNLDDLLKDTPPEDDIEVAKVQEESKHEKQPVANEIQKSEERVLNKDTELILGKFPESRGAMFQNSHIFHPPLLSSSLTVGNAFTSSICYNSTPNNSFLPSTLNNSRLSNAFDRIGTGLDVQGHTPKRPKLFNDSRSGSNSTYNSRNLSQVGVTFSGTARQVTLDQFQNWESPAFKRKSTCEYSFDSPMLRPSRLNSTNSEPRQRITTTGNARGTNNTSSIKHGAVAAQIDGCPETKNEGTLVGSICNDASMHPAKINGFIGIFHPMNMLYEFPSLKLELGIEFVRVSGSNNEFNYIVAKEYVPSLFAEFLTRVDPDVSCYPQIFHKLNLLTDIRGTWQSNTTKSRVSDIQGMTQFEDQSPQKTQIIP